MSALTYLTTFSLGGYLSTILARYHERFNTCCQSNGAVTLVSLISGAELQNEVVAAATLMRWTVRCAPECRSPTILSVERAVTRCAAAATRRRTC